MILYCNIILLNIYFNKNPRTLVPIAINVNIETQYPTQILEMITTSHTIC